jgi:hypothetical protein
MGQPDEALAPISVCGEQDFLHLVHRDAIFGDVLNVAVGFAFQVPEDPVNSHATDPADGGHCTT